MTYLPMPPHDCDADGHSWIRGGYDPDSGRYMFRCRFCPVESEA